jgi:hypothetical protein
MILSPHLTGSEHAVSDFEALARELRASEIYVGLQTAPHGMMVWITDKMGRVRVDHLIEYDVAAKTWNADTAARWLHDRALELFPDSAYAREHRGFRRYE